MANRQIHRGLWTGVPPWIFIGAVVVLFPIFAFITIDNINREKENSIRLLLEKGAALIRSFEAGTRTGMMGMQWGRFQLQQLLTETAQQADIVYLLVAEKNGTVVAHGDSVRIGQAHGEGLDLARVARSTKVQWRIVNDPDGTKIFEVFRKFSPTGGPMRRYPHRRMFFEQIRPRLEELEKQFFAPSIIFVGLDMSSIEAARISDIRHSIIMGTILLLVGFAGIGLLFLAQSYRSTRASLTRIKAFSDNLVENMPIGLLALDHNTRIISFNNVAGAVLQSLSAKAIGSDAQTVLPPEIWEPFKILAQGAKSVEREIDCKLTNGRIIPLEINATQLKDEEGTFLGYILLFKDLAEVHALKKEIARSQRLASVGRLAAGVAHEVRNPLSSIKGFATYFKERYRDVPEDQQIANIMILEVDRLNRVVSQLLDFARPIKLSKKSIQVNNLVKDSLKMVEPQANEADVRITTELSADTKQAALDPDKINQVLLNLYLNAIESMPSGGGLMIGAAVNAAKKRVEISISDTGTGINQADLGHVFDPYFTTKASGTGLGLAIVHNILEAHHGEIKIESRIGQGTTVRLSLPQGEEGEGP